MRKYFSLSVRVKRMMSPISRVALCRVLETHYNDAMECPPDQPMSVCIGEDTYTLCQSTKTEKKVRVDV